MPHDFNWYIKHNICEHQNSGPFRSAIIGQKLNLNHCAYGVYSPTFAATTVPSMLKCPDYRIRELH